MNEIITWMNTPNSGTHWDIVQIVFWMFVIGYGYGSDAGKRQKEAKK
jgi:hypothetical protein